MNCDFKDVYFSVPVVGNFSEEDANGIPQDNSLEYPLQRDEVQSSIKKGSDRNFPQGKCEPGVSNKKKLLHQLVLVLSPKPIDQKPETSLIGLIIAILTTIILLLVVIILFIIARQKRTRTAAVLDALQHNLHSDGLGLSLDKRFNSNFKVSLLGDFFGLAAARFQVG